jgi:hypothetical protein
VSERPQNKHLKPFKKGDDPRRCKKGKQALPNLDDLIEELGDEGMRAVITALHKQAKRGNVKAIETLLDRYYGKVKQGHDLTTNGESFNDLSQLPTEELIKRAEAVKKLKDE